MTKEELKAVLKADSEKLRSEALKQSLKIGVQHRPSYPFRDKTKYTRKRKHKNSAF